MAKQQQKSMQTKLQTKLAGVSILLGVTGSVAAYKAAYLARLLVTAKAKVQVAMTPTATKFVNPLTFQALTGNKVLVDMFDGQLDAAGMDHIASVRAADIFVIAPASATTIARLVSGSADEIVSALACAADCPLLVAPAMNTQMISNPAVVRNLQQLELDGYHILFPTAGDLACGEYGPGRLNEPESIVDEIKRLLALNKLNSNLLAGKKVVVSAGATAEAIDSMRIITNRSSGKMGYAMAVAAQQAGADVHFVGGLMQIGLPSKMKAIEQIESTKQLEEAVTDACKKADCYISTAAVADFRPKVFSKTKLKRKQDNFSIELKPTTDIVAKIAAYKNAPFTVAFAATDGNLDSAITSARAKLKQKKVNAIIASPLATNLGGDNCELAWLSQRKTLRLGKLSKAKAASKIVEQIASKLS